MRELERRLDAQKARRTRWTLTYYAQKLSNDATIQFCGRSRSFFAGEGMLGDGVQVVLDAGGEARYSGVASCGSVWECPSCMQKISSRRAGELRELVGKHRAAGGGAYMLTLTVPHDAGDDLSPMRKAIAKAWQYSIAGAPWKRMRSQIDFTGFVRALELTHGVNSWHPHLHTLILTDRPLEVRRLTRLKRFLYCRWARKISAARGRRSIISSKVERRADKKRRGAYRLPTYANGISLVESRKDDYLAKMGLSDEIARGSRKKARGFGSHRTPLEILAGVASRHTLKCHDAVLWKEYARAMKGARQLTFSRGLREKYGQEPEQTDLDLAIAAEKSPALYVGTIDGNFWERVMKDDYDARCTLLSAVEYEGERGFRLCLEANGYDFPIGPPEARPRDPPDRQLSLIA